ncbi:hypothetical protein [Fluviicola chungangensis]|uniref:Uncharacterized protein n=1 Tax=Fluviicola chungangensis TaxID=2597671 RepID=A0A556MR43_9FLAO|nr:hypothetical protein [Fluviicola chungangensis]TSJ42387.1 hypothetical protein FO442_11510 [Fluviicola chungangensis]
MEKDRLHILSKIERVEVSPFLFTRIHVKVREQVIDRLSTGKSVVYLAGIAMIIAVNVLVLRSMSASDKKTDLVSELNLAPSNQLYP